jgi:predicted nuclease of predicted toxin-antitoxin system
MRLFLDQMFRVEVADWLRAQGHEVARASERGMRRADDEDILHRAVAEQRTLITLDQHFGDWVILPLSESHGVIRVKARPATTEKIIQILQPFLAAHPQEDFRNHLIIVSASRARWIRTSP